MIMMMLCGLIDLYFVSGSGDAAIAGVGAAGNAGFLIKCPDASAEAWARWR